MPEDNFVYCESKRLIIQDKIESVQPGGKDNP